MVNSFSSFRRRSVLLLLVHLLIALSFACSFPIISQETPTPTAPPQIASRTGTPPPPPTPTSTPQPLPPQIIEVDPPPGGELPVQGGITLYFNQAMDRDSVEAALSGQAGRFEWQDDASLTILPESPLTPDSAVDLSLDAGAQAANGLSFSEPVDLHYRVVGYLNLVERLPDPGAAGVDPASAVVATFNLPVVPLGGEAETLPPAFTLSPDAQGRGEWLNTSTYIFYPDGALSGGVTYDVQISPQLVSADGSPLQDAESWTFNTAPPELIALQPEPGASGLRLDAKFILSFNQPMNPDSVAQNLSVMQSNAEPVPGELAWNEDHTQATFTPQNLLRRSQTYQLILGAQAQSMGGTPLERAVESSYETVEFLRVTTSEPFQGGRRSVFSGVVVHFNAPIRSKDILQFVNFSPEVTNLQASAGEDDRSLNLFGNFSAETDYTLTLSPNLPDAWSGRLGQEFTLDFRTLPLEPDIFVTLGSNVLFLTPEESHFNAQITNLSEISLSLGSLSIDSFITLSAPNNFNALQGYESEDERTYQYNLSLQSNRAQPVDIPLTLGTGSLLPGLYYVRFNVDSERIYPGPFLLVVSDIQLTFKLSATDALVWAVDLRDGEPLDDVPIVLYAEDGTVLARGDTDDNGILKTAISGLDDVFSASYAVLGQPGDENFALALSTWSQGLEGWNFGIPTDFAPPHLEAYLYTDRPIYRPGQTVYFRAIARQAYNGRYALPERGSLPVSLFNDQGERITDFDLALSDFGSGHGSYTLPPETSPGYYTLSSEPANFSSVSFQVAEFRKPEIDLSVSIASDQVQAGETQAAGIQARYFFDAPAGNVPIEWRLFTTPAAFNLPEYQVGIQDPNWLAPFSGGGGVLGELISEGEGRTDQQGNFDLEFSPMLSDARQRYTLEVTAQDESGLPVSARSSVLVNPAEYYIGVRPDSWVGQAGTASGFEVVVVDWAGVPAGSRALRAEFQKVVWERVDSQSGDGFNLPEFEPQYTPIGNTDFVTSNDGKARLAFTPPEPGTYQLDVRGLHSEERGAHTQAIVWVGGSGQAIWPNLPDQRLQLTADKSSYQPGESARVFIPNPFSGAGLALVTVERGVILRHQVVEVGGAGRDIQVSLGDEEAPNIYVSVTLLEQDAGGLPDFRQGYVELVVEPLSQTLNVSLEGDPRRTGPGEAAIFDLRVTDAEGNPAAGEFSLAVVDEAVLALSDPNSEDILSAFYDEQALGVRTGLALAAHTHRRAVTSVGGGGGGGDFIQPLVVREDFLDTAFWQADILTDADGRASIEVALPDNLTTWQADLRGVTADSRVGQAAAQVVTSKDLIVRPVTPRFLVQGDHAMLAAVVHNNTDRPLMIAVNLQSGGFELDEDSSAQRDLNLPAGGRQRVEWWGRVQAVESADLVFSARAGELQDAARPASGPLPVLNYSAPQTYGTSGVLDEGGERLEVVSLPRSFEPQGGALNLELAPSLGAAMMDSLAALEDFPYTCTEQILSRFLPNLETYRVIQGFGLEAPNLRARLARTVDQGLAQLRERQNQDGGWGWWPEGQSDAYVTAYVLFGLFRAREAGVGVNENLLQPGLEYLLASLPAPEMLTESWQFDRLAFQQLVLSQFESSDPAGVEALFEERERLNPWAQAFLAQAIENLSPGDERVESLLSDLRSRAIRSSTGVHWEEGTPGYQNMSSPIFTSAVVLHALAQHDPASPLLADGVRYLMAHRRARGDWASTYETAWTLMALAEVIKGTGELGGEFEFSAVLNGAPLAGGQAGGASQLTPVKAEVPLSSLHPGDPNALLIERQAGAGRLYYSAHLRVNRPVESVPLVDSGVAVSRAYYPSREGCAPGGCEPIRRARSGDLVDVRVTITVPETAYYLLVEDYIPAGAEVLDTSLKTSQQGIVDCGSQLADCYDPHNPFREGWGWWYFGSPQIRDDRVAWAADVLPPGTYQLAYTLVILHPGEYRVLPARAWQFYFPEVQGNSAGEVFRIDE